MGVVDGGCCEDKDLSSASGLLPTVKNDVVISHGLDVGDEPSDNDNDDTNENGATTATGQCRKAALCREKTCHVHGTELMAVEH